MLGAGLRSLARFQEGLREDTSGAEGMGFDIPDVPVIATATAVTLSVRQLLAGLILQDPAGGAVTTTTPTATAILAALKGAKVGSSILFAIRNTADASEAITLAGGTSVTISGTATIAQNNTKLFLLRVTGFDTPAVTIYSLGTFVH